MKLKSDRIKEDARKRIMDMKKQGFHKKGGLPEVQIHCAITLIEIGDPFSLTKEKRQDQELEIGQFAVRFEDEKSFGNLTPAHIDNVMRQFKHAILTRMRDYGVLRTGS